MRVPALHDCHLLMSLHVPVQTSASVSAAVKIPADPALNLLVLLVLALMAVAMPALLAYHLPPSVTFLNQAVSLTGWGLLSVSICVLVALSPDTRLSRGCWPAVAALAVLAGAVVLSWTRFGLPLPLALSSLGFIGAAILVMLMGTLTNAMPAGREAFQAFCLALVVAGLGSVLVAIVQYFFPGSADGDLIARLATPGRAGGNLRQPNHLSSLLLLSIAALVWVHEDLSSRLATDEGHVMRVLTVLVMAVLGIGAVLTGSRTGTLCIVLLAGWGVMDRRPSRFARGYELHILRVLTVLAMLGFVFGVVLTVSRTGTVCILLLAGWGVMDRRLSRFARWMLWTLPLVYLLFWVGMYFWAEASSHAFAGGDQLLKSDPSSSRYGIWANAWDLIKLHPWLGVGWGEFNFAWTLTPFPGRPGAFFDHTHNLPLQLLAELGLPLGLTVLGLALWALWRAAVACVRGAPATLPAVRTTFVMVLMMGVHSQLEYPLWYAYFLLPTAFALGVCLGGTAVPAGSVARSLVPGLQGLRLALVLGAVAFSLVAGGVLSVADYRRVSQIFVPDANAPPLPQRVEVGRQSVFFAHHADYAAATIASEPSSAMYAFDRAPHYLLDTRLMMAWAKAFEERGDLERARYLWQRLMEFKNPQSAEFFAECDRPLAEGVPSPPQCTPPSRAFTHEDFRPTAGAR
ncbi:MAG: hypothetical protein RLZZ618_3478 [Pseudomonadota bacterium]|jgi:hypothetical protein